MLKTILLFLIISNANALLKIDISKQGLQQIPIAIADFSGFDNNIADIIKNDLLNSGHFSIQKIKALKNNINFNTFKKNKIEAVVFGEVEKNQDNDFEVSFFVYDIWTKKALLSQKINIGKNIIRRISHIISDNVHFALLGEDGFFDTNIAYVSIDKKSELPYVLEVVDSDGFNPQVVLESREPIMSPSWSPDNKSLAYVSFGSGKSKVYIQNVLNKNSLVSLPSFNGISSSPSWHPNGKSLLITLSKDDNQDIYRYFLDGKLERLTKNPSIDTEASFSPDGESIIWTSNRDNYAAIYIKNIKTNEVKKLNIPGKYNVNPSFSPDGKKIILIHSQSGEHKVAEFELKTNDLVVITDNKLDESPSFAPNGKMVIYSYNKNNTSYLAAVSTNGLFSLKLSDGSKQVREPVWSNFL
jgi:TolB protein